MLMSVNRIINYQKLINSSNEQKKNLAQTNNHI